MAGLLPRFTTYDKNLWGIRRCAAALVNEVNFFQFFNPILGIVTSGLGAIATAYAAVDRLVLDIAQIEKLISDTANREGIWEDFTEQLDTALSDLEKAWQGESAEAALESLQKSVESARGQQHNYRVTGRIILGAKQASELLIAETFEAAQEIVNRELPISISKMVDVATNVIDVAEQFDGVVPVASFISDNSAQLLKKIDVARYVLSIPIMVQMVIDFINLMKETHAKLDAIWRQAAADMFYSAQSAGADESLNKCSVPPSCPHVCETPVAPGKKPSPAPKLKGKMKQGRNYYSDHSQAQSQHRSTQSYTGSASASASAAVNAHAEASAVAEVGQRAPTGRIAASDIGSNATTAMNEDLVRKIIDEELIKHQQQVTAVPGAGYPPLTVGYPQQGLGSHFGPAGQFPPGAGMGGMGLSPAMGGVTGMGGMVSGASTPGMAGAHFQAEDYVNGSTGIDCSASTADSTPTPATSTGSSSTTANAQPSWGLKISGELTIDGKGVNISGDLDVGTHASSDTGAGMDCDSTQETEGQTEKNAENNKTESKSEEKTTELKESDKTTITEEKKPQQAEDKTIKGEKSTEQTVNRKEGSTGHKQVNTPTESPSQPPLNGVKKESSTTQRCVPSDSLTSSRLANSGGW